jgi:hypothetical protein
MNNSPKFFEQPNPFPQTMNDAVEQLWQMLTPAEQEKLAAISERHLNGLNSGLGARIRKAFGLWQGNKALMQSCNALNPEDSSSVIIRTLWARLQH